MSVSAPGAILLDALGTLVAFVDPVPALRERLREHHRLEISDEEARIALRAEISAYRRLNGAAGDATRLAELRHTCAGVLRDALPAAAERIAVEALVPTLVAAFRFEPFPEVAEVLDALRARGHPLAVVSNWDVSLHDVLARTGLASRVEAVVVSAEIGAAKPSPVPFQRALALLGARREEALHAGDQLDEDVAGARAAGVEAVLVDRAGDGAPEGVRTIADLRGLLP